ncbi:MAG: type IV pilin N-terminal domain-containing protein, partial [Methanomassiliicoccales archaeon]|nr:type IV pilin N-terminal domain-containing protein [Methanomassiliicoccales archaeon]
MGNISRKLHKNKKGVSEVIANILILGITVTLFSSIMVFVGSMPQPHENAYADFSPSVKYISGTPVKIEVNMTHMGGQELKSYTTAIYLFVNGSQTTLNMSNSLKPLGDKWTVGETFVYRYSCPIGMSLEGAKKLSLSVIVSDTEKNSLLYSANIMGGASSSSSPPILGARGTTPSPTYDSATCSFFVQVMDTDKDLNTNSVYIDLTSVGLSTGPVKMSDDNNDGIFTRGPYTAKLAWNGVSLIVNCSDWAGHQVNGLVTPSILAQSGGGQTYYGPFYNYSSYLINGTYPPDVSGGESGGSAGVGTTFYYIRRLSDMTITRQFNAGERVLIEVYSDKLTNLALDNAFYIYHPITGDAISPQSKATDAFQYGGIYSTFHRYIYNFTAPSSNYIYPIQISAKDNLGTVVNIMDTIIVGGSTYPKLVTYKNVTNSLVASTSFNHTDVVYLKIKVKDVDTAVTNVYISDIEVSDYTGRYIIKKVPPAYSNPPLAYSAPVSCLYKTTTTPLVYSGVGGEYTVRINLRDAYQGWWLPRTNAYAVRIALFSDDGVPGTGEIYSELSTQITVTAPLSTTDILAAVGSGSFTWSSSGATWDNNAIKWYKGGEEWDETTIDAAPNDGPIAMALSDIDNDG